MLSENLKKLRKQKGFTQEELAIRLNVVRQTVSKWEKGLSVPDSEMLIRIAEIFETSVGDLLGETIAQEPSESTELQAIAAKLELLNAQFARQNDRRRKFWRGICIVLFILAALVCMVHLIFYIQGKQMMDTSLGIIGGADGPTAILVSSAPSGVELLFVSVFVLAAAGVGIYLTRRK